MKSSWTKLIAYLCAWEGNLGDLLETWKADREFGAIPNDIKPFVDARRLIGEGDFSGAIKTVGGYGIWAPKVDHFLRLQAEQILCDACLLMGDPKAAEHARFAAFLSPRSRQNGYLIERAFARAPVTVLRYARAASFVFPDQSWWKEYLSRAESKASLNETVEARLALLRSLARQAGSLGSAEAREFLCGQDSFLVEYLCSTIVRDGDPATANEVMEFFLWYRKALVGVSDYLDAHLRAFYRQLLPLLPSATRQRWENALNT